jgi:hypothetical protein
VEVPAAHVFEAVKGWRLVGNGVGWRVGGWPYARMKFIAAWAWAGVRSGRASGAGDTS